MLHLRCMRVHRLPTDDLALVHERPSVERPVVRREQSCEYEADRAHYDQDHADRVEIQTSRMRGHAVAKNGSTDNHQNAQGNTHASPPILAVTGKYPFVGCDKTV